MLVLVLGVDERLEVASAAYAFREKENKTGDSGAGCKMTRCGDHDGRVYILMNWLVVGGVAV